MFCGLISSMLSFSAVFSKWLWSKLKVSDGSKLFVMAMSSIYSRWVLVECVVVYRCLQSILEACFQTCSCCCTPVLYV